MHMALSQVGRKRLVPVYHVSQMERSRMFLSQGNELEEQVISRNILSVDGRDIWLAIMFSETTDRCYDAENSDS